MITDICKAIEGALARMPLITWFDDEGILVRDGIVHFYG